MSKRVLITGGGSKFGYELTKRFSDNGYIVDVITSTNVIHENVNVSIIKWSTITENKLKKALDSFGSNEYDVIFFNHNTGGGPNETDYLPYTDYNIKKWSNHYFINCQIPFITLKYIHSKVKHDTKIGWMISGMVDGKWEDGWKYGGYVGFKATNLYQMRGFSKYYPGIFFCMNPGHIELHNYEGDSSQIVDTIKNLEKSDSGKILFKTGHQVSIT